MKTVKALTIFILLFSVISSCKKAETETKSETETITTSTPKAKLYEEVILPDGTQKVTIDNFIRAETDNYFKGKFDEGYFGKLGHIRQVTPVDKQIIVRMNRDTRYSFGVFDLTEPVTITKPDTGDRFQSMVVINEDHYIKEIHYEPGKYTLTKESIGTRYVQVVFRTLVDASSAEDGKIVDAIQDQILVEQKSPGKFEIPNWDQVSLKATRNLILALAKDVPNSKGMFGDESEVEPIRHLIGTAGGFGGNAEKDATYLNVYPPENDGKTAYVLTVKDVPVDGFWSISIYNAEGYFEKNPLGIYSFNNLTAKKNSDGSITIHFGGDPAQINYVPIVKGWNYTVRLYRPRKEILDGTWKFPEPQPVK